MTKRKTAGTTVTEASAHAVLRRRGATKLAAVEERVMRMRLGAALPRRGEIEWMGTESEELAIELKALEIETYLKLRAHQARQARRATSAASSSTSAAKDKIVRALRRRGPTR
ncbi:MAG: hypothetical protein WCS72_01170 [Deltaproteobacteria bacterium]